MANEKVLQTRIVNKHALKTEWDSSELILKEGEIALARFEVAQADGTSAPTYAAKIGVEGKKFSESPWLFAKASDVYSWAKAETKPGYTATEIVRGTSTVAADLATAESAIQALQTAIGENGSVAEAIKAAIEALDVEDSAVEKQFVTAVAEADGKISVTRRALAADDIPTLEISKINGLQDALNLKANASDVKDTTDAITSRLDSGDIKQAIDTAKTAGDNAQTYAEGVAGDLADYIEANDAALEIVRQTADAARTEAEVNDQIDAKITTYNNTTIKSLDDRVVANATAITNEADRAKGVEGGLDTRLTAAENAIKSLNAATTFAGTGTYAEMNALENVKAGSIFVVIDATEEGKKYNNKEFVYDGSKWVELGDTTAELAEISGLKSRVDAIEADLGAEGDTTKAIEAAQADATQALADAKTANDAIAVINGESEGSIKKAVADAVADLEAYADQAEADALSEAKKYTDAEAKKAADKADAAQSTIDTHAANKNNPHEVTAAQVGLGNVDNKSVATIKSEFTGSITEGNDGFVLGGDAYTAIENAKAAASTDAAAKVKVVADDLAAYQTSNDSAVNTIKNNYARVEGNALVYGQGDNIMTIVFDCGGAE